MDTRTDEIFTAVAEIIVEILDIDAEEIKPDAYLIRDLGVESIDLMELAVSFNERFGLEVDEERIFLKSLRPVIETARKENRDISEAVAKEFPFLSIGRIAEIHLDMEAGPVLKVSDLVHYINQAVTTGD